MIEFSVMSILTGTIVGFIAGTSLTWTSPEIAYLNSTDTGPFNGTLTSDQASWIGGVLSIGAAVGPFIFGALSDNIGRKWTLLAISVPFALSSAVMAFARQVWILLVARLITGIAVGGSFSILPMYIGELSLDKHRGVLGSAMNCFICFGLIFTYVVGYFISSVRNFNLLLAVLAGNFFALFMFLGVESPYYYVQKGKFTEALNALKRIRNNATEEACEKELEQVRQEIEKEEKGTIMDIFRSKGNRKALIYGSGLVFFQQASGINAVLFFASTIFKQAGTSLNENYCSMIIGAVQFSTSFITPIASNSFGRKPLLVVSGIGMALSETILGVYGVFQEHKPDAVSSLNFLPILSLVLYIVTYNIGWGALPWAVIGEVFPTNVKAQAGAICTSVCWITSFIITKWFKQVADSLGQGECFIGFAAFSLISAVFAQLVLMETKGKSLSEIQHDLNK